MNELMRRMLFLPEQASSQSGEIDALHYFVITMTMLVSVGVSLMAAWYTVRYRKRTRDQLTPHIQATALREWSLILTILGMFILWWVIGYQQFVTMFAPPGDAEPVYVTAKQWMWKFTYPDGRYANDVLTLPVGRPVRLALTSRDVIHSFYVPAFRIKTDVLPGRYMSISFEPTKPGVYPIYCAEYCGIAHSRMRGEVVVLSAEDYAKWLHDVGRDGSQRRSELAALGAQVAERRACLACHTINGQPHVGPTWSRLYDSWVTLSDGRRVFADEAYLTRSMMEPQADIVAGFTSVMPTYQGSLPEPEVAALVEFIRSLRDAPVPAGVTLPSLAITPEDAGTKQEQKK